MLTPLSSHVLCLRPGKRGGNRGEGGGKKERGEWKWREVGLLSLTAGGRMCPDPRGEACCAVQSDPAGNLF